MKTIIILGFAVLLLLQMACGQTQPQKQTSETQNKSNSNVAENGDAALRANVKARADEMREAFISGDYGKIIDFTHPKAIEKFGGDKKKVASDMQSQMKSMEAEGYKITDMTFAEPSEIVTAGNRSFAVVPMTMKLNTPQGLAVAESFQIAILEDNANKIYFLGGSGENTKVRLNALFPEVGDKLKIPEEKQPVLQ